MCRSTGRRATDKEEQPAAETKKADGASKTALLIPIPPAVIGKETCFQLLLERVTLQMDSSRFLCSSSNSDNRDERKQGAVRRVYMSLGSEKAFLSRHKTLCACNNFNLSPMVARSEIFFLSTLLMDVSSPMGDPSKVASAGGVDWMDGNSDRHLP